MLISSLLFIECLLVRKLLIVFCLLPIGTLLWPSLAPAWECDSTLSRGICSGSGQKYPAFDRSAVHDPVSSRRILVNEPIGQAAGGSVSSRNALRIVRADAVLPGDFSANRAVQTLPSRSQPGVNATNDGGDKVSPSSLSVNPVRQPGGGALLIAGFLGICAVARRRISSILG
jgi:hypothetical protein